MDSCKLTFILLTILIYLLYQRCVLETFDNNQEIDSIIQDTCIDDSTWFVEDKDGKKHYCTDIGISASCYDRDAVGREGWERCLKTCGNCANTKVTKIPQNILATFSGDPIEDFGVVLNIDKERQFVGKQERISDTDKDKDISNIMDRLDATEDIFELITGNVVGCNLPSGNIPQNKFAGCGHNHLTCPSPTSILPASPTINNYIRQDADGNITFPAKQISCSKVPTQLQGRPDECKKYYLFDRIIDRGSANNSSMTEDNHKITLHDVCPLQCGVSQCPGHYPIPQSNRHEHHTSNTLRYIFEELSDIVIGATAGASAGGVPGLALGGLTGAAVGGVNIVMDETSSS